MAKTIQDLNRLYLEAESADQDLFSEQRSNVLLVSGDHYTKKGSRFWSRIRDSKQLTNEQKIRLTKNHIQKITKTYVNNITSQAPGITIDPKNENEIQDQKAAELNLSVWQDLVHRNKLRKRSREWAKDFIEIGEVFVKTFWDPSAGELKGYEPVMKTDEETGEQSVDEDENGEPKATPIFTGALVHEKHYGFNVLRDASAKSMDESPWIGIRKMSSIDDLKLLVGKDEEKLKFIQASGKDTYSVFDGSNGSYKQTKDQCLVREYYFRPCPTYPMGYFYITTEAGILFEGELPFGIFPISYAGFDEIATSPRARSIIKQLRPYQAEINRSASKIAEHQVTLGDDKIIMQGGSKLTHGGTLAGVRGISVNGPMPTILAGRSGEQYLGYMNSQIQEMYQISNVYEDSEEKNNQLDPYAMLYRSMRHKKKFSNYAEKFEDFLISIGEISLELAKKYYTDDHLIPAIGKPEYVNIPEFRNSQKLCYQIKVEAQTDDAESKLGKQLAMNQVLQYGANQLGKDAVGRFIRCMPFVNEEQAFQDLTLDYDNAINDILALDRGEFVPPNKYDEHPYVIKMLVGRMKKRDFSMLPPQVQQHYQMKVQMHEQMEAQKQQQLLAAQADFIPTGGYLVTCDFYVNDPEDPAKTKRVRLPMESVSWLIKRLEEQGSSLQNLEQVPQQAAAEIGGMVHSNKQAPGVSNGGTANPGVGGEPGIAPTPPMGAGSPRG